MSDPFACAATVRLQAGREIPLRRGHPWVYRRAVVGELPDGFGPLVVEAADRTRLGVALPCASGGSLALRMVAFGDEAWSAETARARLGRAIALRRQLAIDSDAMRVVHAEGDGFPGLVVDRYAEVAVLEPYEPAWEPYLGGIGEEARAGLGCSTVIVRPAWGDDRRARALIGPLPAAPLVVREGTYRLPVDVVRGQKTGLFLDQRDNRRRLGEVARGAEVLNLFSFSAAFSLAALAGGARRAVNVDASAEALGLARQAYALNGLAVADGDFVRGDAFRVAREMAATGARFDVVVVDPPAFVKRRTELDGGLRGYRDINLQAIKLVRPGGLLLTCSCSALVDEQAFARMLLAASVDAGRAVRVLEKRGAAPDHPVALAVPEMRHLKAWLCALD
ncbi:MAG: class I SAM-dependent rRNA methyltransferase [Acidobacteriota bacterium]